MMPRCLRPGMVIAALFVSLLLAPAVAAAPGSHIKSTTLINGNPGLIDVLIDGVRLDKRAGTISVTGSVACHGAIEPDLSFEVLEATQRKGERLSGSGPSVRCDERFTATIPPGSGQPFKPGPAQIDVAIRGCIKTAPSSTSGWT